MHQKHTTRSSIGFTSSLNGRRKTVITLLPGESNSDDGLRYRLYKNRYAKVTGLSLVDIEKVIPARHEDWTYDANADSDWEGFQGFIANNHEIDPSRRSAKAGVCSQQLTMPGIRTGA
jgi:hypothetical protein